MPSPFPGMNPYLENLQIWTGLQSRLMVAIADALVPQLIAKYHVAIEKRVYQATENDSLLVGIADVTVQKITNQPNSPTSNVAVAAPPVTPLKVRMPMLMEFREAYLEVREIATQKVITVIELLSPKNKCPGEGREVYDRAAYNYIIDYTQQPSPTLSETETAWLETHLKEQK